MFVLPFMNHMFGRPGEHIALHGSGYKGDWQYDVLWELVYPPFEIGHLHATRSFQAVCAMNEDGPHASEGAPSRILADPAQYRQQLQRVCPEAKGFVS